MLARVPRARRDVGQPARQRAARQLEEQAEESEGRPEPLAAIDPEDYQT